MTVVVVAGSEDWDPIDAARGLSGELCKNDVMKGGFWVVCFCDAIWQD